MTFVPILVEVVWSTGQLVKFHGQMGNMEAFSTNISRFLNAKQKNGRKSRRKKVNEGQNPLFTPKHLQICLRITWKVIRKVFTHKILTPKSYD